MVDYLVKIPGRELFRGSMKDAKELLNAVYGDGSGEMISNLFKLPVGETYLIRKGKMRGVQLKRLEFNIDLI